VKLHNRYHGAGLEIVAFPCNQYKQERSTNSQIKRLAREHYGAKFKIMQKIASVSGKNAHPIYKALLDGADEEISWNFAKILVDRHGKVVVRTFNDRVSAFEMAGSIQKALGLEASDLCLNGHPIDEECEQWAAAGECKANPGFMLSSCAAACSKSCSSSSRHDEM